MIMCAGSYLNCRTKLAGHHSMINCFLRNLCNSIPSYFSHGLFCPDTLVGDYNKVYIYIYIYIYMSEIFRRPLFQYKQYLLVIVFQNRSTCIAWDTKWIIVAYDEANKKKAVLLFQEWKNSAVLLYGNDILVSFSYTAICSLWVVHRVLSCLWMWKELSSLEYSVSHSHWIGLFVEEKYSFSVISPTHESWRMKMPLSHDQFLV